MLRSTQLFNNIRRYTHNHNSPCNKKIDIIVEDKINVKLDKIMLKLDEIDFLVKCNYAVAVLPALFSVFKSFLNI
jgi:hypothetical protein